MSHCKQNHEHSHVCSISASSTLHQSLDELEFERGIWSAAQSGDLHRVKKLIECKGENVDRLDNAGYTALHYAARSGHLEVCRYLLIHGAGINATTRAGSATPLHRACTAGKLSIVELLLTKNADVFLKDADGKTALHRAAENGHTCIYKLLQTMCPDLESVLDNKSKTPSDYINP